MEKSRYIFGCTGSSNILYGGENTLFLKRLFLKLLPAQMVIIPFLFQEFPMFPALEDFAVLYHENHVRVADGREPVRDNKGCPSFQKLLCRLLDKLFGLGVDGGSCLVEHEDSGVGNDGAGKGNKLLLSGGEASAATSVL